MTDESPPSGEESLDPNADFIAVQLRRAREDANLSVIELARLTGLSKTVLHGYERGRTKPGAREIRVLSNALKVSPNWLVFGAEDFQPAKSTLTSLYRKIKARPGLGAVLATAYLPLILPWLDESELESLLVLAEALVRAKHAETADKMLMVAEELATGLDEVILPSGELAPGQMESVMKRVQERIQERLAGAGKQQPPQG